MRIPLDRHSDKPLYQQIADHIRQGILSGSLSPETRLTASRQLARDLGVNRITVEAAYSELEADGLIYSRVGSGTYVLPAPTLPLSPLQKDGQNIAWPLWQQHVQIGLQTPNDYEPYVTPQSDQRSDFISFSGGTSASHMFPADDFRKVLQAVMRRDGMSALEYGESNGYPTYPGNQFHPVPSFFGNLLDMRK